MKETLLFIGGFYNLAFAVFHILFWKIFKWKRSLRRLLPMDRAIMQVLNIRLIYIFFVFAYVSIFHQEGLISTQLGKVFIIIISLFWFMRAIEQIIFFGLKNLVSIVFMIISIIGAIFYLIPILI
ncbi:MAG: hypothetical protein HQ534_12890 [Armatimonadetes bacterium]|nr:hypothetical protein [Armatimonadota bacterium]